MSLPQSGTMIEGVGDEVVHILGAFLVIAIPLMIAYLNRNQNQRYIHPDNLQAVNRTREELGIPPPTQHENGASETSASSTSTSGGEAFRRRRYNTDPTCPICLVEKRFATETNCGHVFCGMCLITYWRHGTWLGAIACPVCRQQVTVLFPCFREVDVTVEEAQTVSNAINDYNRRFSGDPRPIMDILRDLPTLLRHAMREFFSFSGLVWMFRLRIILCFFAAIVYFISPLDIIPEAVFGVLGFLDDIFVLLLLAIYVTIIYRGIIANRGMGADT
ncbi:E3 ubiquitin-protein ligase RNF170-like [Amphiura filiformis]|uniref:E3 ubiquitin-protein ligase RNF170-like n=1 Tax=Amphiura filiformis TaxID=82378 RepID=UPI003B216C15